ncbi:hypothetical protein K504DRAFT_538630 [Pleomassaria siparia CBS 279.74]|uniref:Zn(2)-C6 fungal-type domain-containing protein n=1 Tax=Pleomassaria siparia CBS 279.74 TaxID=1314801 RepID=A0A6G1JU27_9PLEO|nr:hypothetical protein K504DRAFT_538630 [Pleomassaria siparia CBS 279.74]
MTRSGFPNRLMISHQSRRINNSLRRNGKPQACEPCRKGKLRCDHMMPTCGRCARRKNPDLCIYHPAPLTKAATPQSTQAISTGSSTSTTVIPSYEFQATPDTGLRFPPFDEPPPPSRLSRASSLPSQPWSSIIYGQQTVKELRRPLPTYEPQTYFDEGGYLHHHAVLAENELSVGILPANSTRSEITSKVTQIQIERGMIVLSLLKDLPLFQTYIERWFSFTRGIVVIEPMVKIWTSGAWSSWHKFLKDQKPTSLRHLSERIWDNTLKAPCDLLKRHTSPRDFCARTTGNDLRWEVVGIIVTLVALLAKTLQDGDPIFCSHDDPPVDREALALKCFNASELCVGFCTDHDLINDIFLWLLYENTLLYCSMHTTGSYGNWQKSGYLATAIMSYGLHREIKVNDRVPFFIAELRKRLFIVCYQDDKYSALFVGRPPRLTRQYCRIQMPLDLNDAQLMSDGPDLENAILNLDNGGWNQYGRIEGCTYSRLFAWNALIDEEILEISLGVLEPQELIQRAADIQTRAIQLSENLPDFLRTDPSDTWDGTRAPVEHLFLAYIRLADLGHHFLIQRTLIKKVGAESTKLLGVCRDMFKEVMRLTNNRDMMRDFHIDFKAILCMYGIPSAAVIAVELLHQERDPTSVSALANPLPRSDTIQELSVFVACLASIRPNSGGPSCARGKKFLRTILDTILSPPRPVEVTRESTSEMENLSLFQTSSDVDFMRWLETMEWEPESWVNYGQSDPMNTRGSGSI